MFVVPRWMFVAAIGLMVATASAVSFLRGIPTVSDLNETNEDLKDLHLTVLAYASCVDKNFHEVRLRVALGSRATWMVDRLDKELARFAQEAERSKQSPQAAVGIEMQIANCDGELRRSLGE